MDKLVAKLTFDLGKSLYNEGRLEEALYYYKKSLIVFEGIKSKENEADALLEIGDTYFGLKNLEEAHKYYKRALESYNRKEDLIGKGNAYMGLGNVFQMFQKYESAQEYYKKALEIFKKSGNYDRVEQISNHIATTYKVHNVAKNGILDFKTSTGLLKSVNYNKKVVYRLNNLKNEKSKITLPKNELLVLIVYLLVIGLSELVITYFSLQLGLLLDVFLLFALLFNSTITKSANLTYLLRSMMILPLIRIMGLYIPNTDIQPLYWYSIIAIILFAASFTIAKSQELNRKKIGIVLGNIYIQILVALSGIIIGTIEYFILKPKTFVPSFNWESFIIASIIIIISTGLAEELFFRGILQRNAEKLLGNVFGLLYASLLFTFLHIGWNSSLDMIFVFVVALFYGFVFQKTRSIVGITVSHGLSNIILFIIMPFFAFLLI